MIDEETDWRSLREFRGIDLSASFALGFKFDGGKFQVDADLCLLEDHAFYETPRPAEKACFRPASIDFDDCREIVVDSGESATDLRSAAAAIGGGQMRDFRKTGPARYRFEGDFGTVAIIAERPVVRFRNRPVR